MTGDTIVLITAINRGIGQEVAVQLAGLGHHALVGSRDARRGETTVEHPTTARRACPPRIVNRSSGDPLDMAD